MTRADVEAVIANAQQRATGATVHNVNGMIGVLRATINLTERPGRKPEQLAEDYRILRNITRRLRDYLEHGDAKKARADNPLYADTTDKTYSAT